MIKEDDRTRHNSKHINSNIRITNNALRVHIQARISHNRQYFSEPLSRDRDLLRRQNLRQRLRQQLHHGGGVRKEQRQAIRELVLNFERRVLLRHLHSGEVSPIEREVVLNGGRRHLRLVELDGEVDEVAELLGRRLLLGDAVLGRLGRVAEGHDEGGEHTLDLLRVLVVARDLVDAGEDGLPGGVLGLGGGDGDGLADELVTAFVGVEGLENGVGAAQNGGDLVPDVKLFFSWLAIYILIIYLILFDF